MSVSLYLAPSGYGKTEYALRLVKEEARSLARSPRVCVANRRQRASWQRRLAQKGGCIGVRLLTFDELYEECLAAAGQQPAVLENAIQYRLLRSVVRGTALRHYGPIRDLPGLIQELQRTIFELKSARISPDAFQAALAELGAGERLREVALIYAAYERRLRENDWVDRPGLGWRAVDALCQSTLPLNWDLTVFDGFDSFTQTQLDFLALLADVADPLLITLTGEIGAEEPRRAHRRFHRTRLRLEETLHIEARPLPESSPPGAPALSHLEEKLFRFPAERSEALTALRLVALPDHTSEVRVALRWLKRCIVRERASSAQVALLARDLAPYRAAIMQVASEFGMALDLQDGLPLGQNPFVGSFLTLLKIMLPEAAGEEPGGPAPALPRRQVLSVLRSPYFDWERARVSPDSDTTVGITPRDVDALDHLARRGRVIGGRRQWMEMLDALATDSQPGAVEDRYEEQGVAAALAAEDVGGLRHRFLNFLQRMDPPPGRHTYREFVAWIAGLIGTGEEDSPENGDLPARRSLGIAPSIEFSDETTRLRDVAALRKLGDILQGLLWAERAGLVNGKVTFSEFFTELSGAVEDASYLPHARQSSEAIFVGNVVQSRGVPFRFVALLGLSEGLFPTVLADDPVLTHRDRALLAEVSGLQLDSPLESNEQEYFYEAVTRPWEELLLTRPRLAETGGVWQPSPFWQELERLFSADVEWRDSRLPASPTGAASLVEWLEALARPELEIRGADPSEVHWAQWNRLNHSATLFRRRYQGKKDDHDGHIPRESPLLADRFGPDHRWSASSLERYRLCPFLFFVADVLQLEPPVEPGEGLDARQLGTLYHRILEAVYRRTPPSQRNDAQALKERLAATGDAILDRAPQQEGFRATAWWQQTREEILEDVRRSIDALSELPPQYTPSHFEIWFGGESSLKASAGRDAFLLHGIIDRIDVDHRGRLRLMDYKTAGPYAYTARALDEGKKIQLALYAAAAQTVLQLGNVDEGFYWHVRHAEASPFNLADYGPREAIESAVSHAWSVVHHVRSGEFTPEPPQGGCPDYCPAVAFCWRYTPRGRW